MLLLNIEDIRPVVRLANHHRVHAGELWDRRIPDLQLISILSGSFEFIEAHQVLSLQPGDILFIEPNLHHRFSIASHQHEGRIAGVHFELTPEGRWAAGDYRLTIKPDRLTRLEDPSYLQDRFQQMAAVYESYRPYRQELVSAITAEIFLILAAHWQTETLWSANPSERMLSMLTYIRDNLALPLTRRHLAKTFNLSPGYINELFQTELGMAPSAVINRERLARAYQLMDRDGLSVSEAAASVGYQDPFYFSRVFKQVYMIPPSEVASKKHRRS